MDDARQIAEHCAGQREADEEVTLVEPGELRVEAADPPQPLSAAEGGAEGHGTAVAQARSYEAVGRHRPTDVAIDDAPVLVDALVIRVHDRDPVALRLAAATPRPSRPSETPRREGARGWGGGTPPVSRVRNRSGDPHGETSNSAASPRIAIPEATATTARRPVQGAACQRANGVV